MKPWNYRPALVFRCNDEAFMPCLGPGTLPEAYPDHVPRLPTGRTEVKACPCVYAFHLSLPVVFVHIAEQLCFRRFHHVHDQP